MSGDGKVDALPDVEGPLKLKTLLEWKGFGNGVGGWRSICGLRVYDKGAGLVVCVATELRENAGTSVTNAAEWIATLVFARYGLDPKATLWVEHYPRDGNRPETWNLVSFELELKRSQLDPRTASAHFARPQWKRLSRAHAADLCGVAESEL